MYGICNVVGASIPRNTDSGTYIHVGPEIGVASTKAFTGQVTVLMLLALCVGQMRGTVDDATVERIVRELKNMPLYIKDVLGLADKIKNLSKIYTYARNFLYLGRGYNYPTALEGALKLKEISYIHAEGYPAAEMKINKDFPEFYDSDGSLLVVAMASEVVCDEVNFLENINNDDEGSYVGLSDISEVLDDKILQPVINKKLQYLTLVKLSSGYMVDNSGHIYTNITYKGTERQIFFKEIYTTDGKLVESFQGKNFSLPNGTTTVGIDQYRFFSQYGMKAKTLGLLKQVGGIWDIFSFIDILKMGIGNEKESLPIPLPGADVLGMLSQVKFQEFDEICEQYRDNVLEETKRKGLAAVSSWIKSPIAENKYELLEISHITAGKVLLGDFKTLDELIMFDDSLVESEKDIAVLLRIKLDPITESEIYVIESFFKK